MADVLLVDIPLSPRTIPSFCQEVLYLRLKEVGIKNRENLPAILPRQRFSYSQGLLSIASFLECKGLSVKYLSYNDIDPDDLVKEAKNARVVGVTAMTPTIDIAATVCQTVKTANEDAITVVGGYHVTYLDIETLLQESNVDMVVRGEGEYTFLDIVENTNKLSKIRGITYRDTNGDIRRNPPREAVKLENLPIPAYHLLPRAMRDYNHNLSTQRGCPYQCKFCVGRGFWRRVRCKSLDQILAELHFLNSEVKEPTLVHISDSIFPYSKRRTLELCKGIQEERLTNLYFSCDVRAEFVDEELVKELADSNFVRFNLGFEDSNEAILSKAAKSSSMRKNLEACFVIRKNSSALIGAYWITGLPGSTHLSMRKNISAIQYLIRNDIVDQIKNKIFVPYPGTPIFEKPKKYGVTILTKKWDKYDYLMFPVYRLDTLSEYEIYSYFVLLESIILEKYRRKLDIDYEELKILKSLPYSRHVYDNYISEALKVETRKTG